MDYQSPEINELASALAKAQAEMPLAEASSTNPFFKSKYTDMASFIKASRPTLTKYGLSVSQFIIQRSDNASQKVETNQQLKTMLLHASGQYLSSVANITPPKTDIQSLGSYLTYLRRYMYAAIIGCVSGNEDDDGESAMMRPRRISNDQATQILTKLKDHKEAHQRLLQVMRINSISEMTSDRFEQAIRFINSI